MEDSDIGELCDDVILHEIISFLELNEVLNLSLVSKEFYNLTSSNHVWKRFYLRDYEGEGLEVIDTIRERYVELRTRDVKDFRVLKKQSVFHKITISPTAEDCRFSFSMYFCPLLFLCGLFYISLVIPPLFLDGTISGSPYIFFLSSLPFLICTLIPLLTFFVTHFLYSSVFRRMSLFCTRKLERQGYYERTGNQPDLYSLVLDPDRENQGNLLIFSTETCLYFTNCLCLMVPLFVITLFTTQIVGLIFGSNERFTPFCVFAFLPICVLSFLFIFKCCHVQERDFGPGQENGSCGFLNQNSLTYFIVLFLTISYAVEKFILVILFLLSFDHIISIIVPITLVFLEICLFFPVMTCFYFTIVCAFFSEKGVLVRINMLLNYYQTIIISFLLLIFIFFLLIILKGTGVLGDLPYSVIFIPVNLSICVCMYLNLNICVFSAHYLFGKKYLSWRDRNLQN